MVSVRVMVSVRAMVMVSVRVMVMVSFRNNLDGKKFACGGDRESS